jgi:TonB family protein
MINRRNRYFIISVMLSVFFHYAFLNILFIPPHKEAEEEKFSHFNVRLGIRKQVASHNVNDKTAEVTSAVKKADTSKINENTQDSKTKTDSIPDSTIAKNAPDNNSNQIKNNVKNITSAINNQEKKTKQDRVALHNEMKRVVENLANTLTYPKPAEELSNTGSRQNKTEQNEITKNNNTGRTIGNSLILDDGNETLTYTKMLPLWIEQFIEYPEQVKLLKLKGVGVAEITITRDGHILKKQITKSTGNVMLDNTIIEMLKKADPVIPVPDDYLPELSLLTYKMEFNLQP